MSEDNTPAIDLEAFAKKVAEETAAKIAMKQAEQKAAEEAEQNRCAAHHAAYMRLLHTAHHAAPRAARASEGPQTQTATQRGRLWCGRGWTPARLPLACCTQPACAACPPTVRHHI